MSLVFIKVDSLNVNPPSVMAQIHKAVNQIEGVINVKVYIDKSDVRIEYETSETTQRKILSEVKKINLSNEYLRITNEFGDILNYL